MAYLILDNGGPQEVTTTAADVVPARRNRVKMLITNLHATETVWVCFAREAVVGQCRPIGPGRSYEDEEAPAGQALSAIVASGTADLYVEEWVRVV